mmetsp:Transcript_3780/g.9017  ORF Transcript_3780/g.9017 Transcript_3780/m.9017 type:complete len:106 (+) Transcript_3780:67-384(+)
MCVAFPLVARLALVRKFSFLFSIHHFANPRGSRKRLLSDLLPIFDKARGFGLVDPVHGGIVKDIEMKTLGAHLPRFFGCQHGRGCRDGQLVVRLPAQKAVSKDAV